VLADGDADKVAFETVDGFRGCVFFELETMGLELGGRNGHGYLKLVDAVEASGSRNLFSIRDF
jgi:hypothetical protein